MPTTLDTVVFEKFGKLEPDEAQYFNAYRWYVHILSFGEEMKMFEVTKILNFEISVEH